MAPELGSRCYSEGVRCRCAKIESERVIRVGGEDIRVRVRKCSWTCGAPHLMARLRVSWDRGGCSG